MITWNIFLLGVLSIAAYATHHSVEATILLCTSFLISAGESWVNKLIEKQASAMFRQMPQT